MRHFGQQPSVEGPKPRVIPKREDLDRRNTDKTLVRLMQIQSYVKYEQDAGIRLYDYLCNALGDHTPIRIVSLPFVASTFYRAIY